MYIPYHTISYHNISYHITDIMKTICALFSKEI